VEKLRTPRENVSTKENKKTLHPFRKFFTISESSFPQNRFNLSDAPKVCRE
jgi:hypothetical protein